MHHMTTKLDKQGQASSKQPGYHRNKGGILSEIKIPVIVQFY